METDEKRPGKDAAALSGGHLCHVCGYQYPNPHPSAKLRRSHRKHCGKAAPALAPAPAAVAEEGEAPVGSPAGDREEGNAGARALLLPVENGELVEGNSDANGAAALLGSAKEVGESADDNAGAELASSIGTFVHQISHEINENDQINCMNTENASPDDKVINSELSKNGLIDYSSNSKLVNECNGTQLPVACNSGSQNEVVKQSSELAPSAVTNPTEREDSFDEFQDASPFLHQSDSEDGALPTSEFPVEINNLNTFLSGSSVAANEISLGTNGLCKKQVSGELNLNDLSAGSKVGNESMVLHSENNPTDSSRELSTLNWPVKDTSDVLLPVENLCREKMCSTLGFENNLPPIINVDDTLNPITRNSCSDMDFTFEAMTQGDVVEQVNLTEETPIQKTAGFTEGEMCNKQIDTEVPTEDQFPNSQKSAVLTTSQTYCAKNPFDLDDDRNDELFELPTDSCYLEVPSVVSRHEVDSASLILDEPTISNQTMMAEAQHSHKSNDATSSSENGHPIGPKDMMPESSSAELVMNTHLADAPLDCHLPEDGTHINGISFAPYQVAPMEFHTVWTQDTNASSAGAEENMQTEEVAAKQVTVIRITDDIEMKQADDTTATDTYAINGEAKNVTDDTAAKMNEFQNCNVEGKHIDSTKEVSVLQSMSHLEENKPTEDPNTKEMKAEVIVDDLQGKWQTDDSSSEKTKTIVCIDNFEEMYAPATRAKEVIALQCTEKVSENKLTNAIVGQEGDKKKEEIAVTGGQMNSGRIRVPLKVLLAEASAENKVNKPSAKGRVLSFGRLVSKNDNSSAKSGSPKSGSDDHRWDTPAKLKDTGKSSKGRKQPWMPFICCHSVR